MTMPLFFGPAAREELDRKQFEADAARGVFPWGGWPPAPPDPDVEDDGYVTVHPRVWPAR